jgi:hypothetical protein
MWMLLLLLVTVFVNVFVICFAAVAPAAASDRGILSSRTSQMACN